MGIHKPIGTVGHGKEIIAPSILGTAGHHDLRNLSHANKTTVDTRRGRWERLWVCEMLLCKGTYVAMFCQLLLVD